MPTEEQLLIAREKELGHKPLVIPNPDFMPAKELFSGYEIEKKFVLMTVEQDNTKNKNALQLYDRTLKEGTLIKQGYIQDLSKAKEVLDALGIKLTDTFRPNTVRLRQYGNQYILTLKDKKETKRREVEYEITRKQFKEYWPLTKGARLTKVRNKVTQKGFLVEYDAFTDRILLLAEIEVKEEKQLEKVPKLGVDVTNDSRWSNKNLAR